MEEEHTKEPSHNNPEEAADYVKAANTLLQSFVNDIHGFNHYARQDAYKNFLHTLSQLLSKLDSAYFTKMDTEVILDTIPDKECAAFLERPEETADKVQQRVSSDSIPTGPEVTSKMRLQGNIQTFDKSGQEAITKLFGHLQDAHNHMAQVAQAVVNLSKVSSPEQFTFVLQLAVRPIIQLKIPPHLSAPTELKFDKERLTPEKAPKKRCTSDVKTADPKPSTSQAQPQDESISEQQPQDESASEQQPQGEASTDTQQGPVPSQFSDNDELPDPYAFATKTFATKDPRSIPKKPKYSLRPKTLHI